MLFNSIDFALFLPIVFLIYWSLAKLKNDTQNLFVVLVSYLFYGWWDYRFLGLIIFSTLVDYTVGLKLDQQKHDHKRKLLLWISILINLSLLGFFKYCNFFIDNFNTAFTFFGSEIEIGTLKIILPVGISFYTFQTLSYTIDVYKKQLAPTKNFIAFAAFVAYFPQLVAGPIERAKDLLPQFYTKRKFEYHNATNGLRQVLWGLFKKIVIADNCADFVNTIYNSSSSYSGSTLVLATFFFAFQIYCDFSGYSDIAIGTSRLFGFKLSKNFAFPYFSRDIAEFWRRWHISLSTWFRDYIYIPLGGSKGGLWMKLRNTFIIFGISGFWHGPNWTFVAWGLLNAMYFLPLLLTNKNRVNTNTIAEKRLTPSIKEFFLMASTFLLINISWVFFRSDNLTHAFEILTKIFSMSLFNVPDLIASKHVITLALIFIFIITEWIGRENEYAIKKISSRNKFTRYSIYYTIILALFLFTGEEQMFIYFQF